MTTLEASLIASLEAAQYNDMFSDNYPRVYYSVVELLIPTETHKGLNTIIITDCRVFNTEAQEEVIS